MHYSTRFKLAAGAVALLALGLTGCGDGPEPIAQVYVMGDSLADVGTFGFKFTVQDATNPKGFPVWTQLVANDLGLAGSAQCNFFSYAGANFLPNVKLGCTNYAIGGGRVRVADALGGAANPQTVGTQMATRAALGAYVNSDLVLIDGGGNDVADLVAAYLGASTNPSAYQTFLLQQLDLATVSALLPVPNGAALAAGAYMDKLADTFYGQIKSKVLDNKASHVVVLNAPDITLTPRFQMLLGAVAEQSSPADAAALTAAIRQWTGVYNAKLKANIGTDNRVALVDFYAELTDQVNNPASYGLTNVMNPVCPVTGMGTDGLPDYAFPLCTSAALDAEPGKTAGWWKTYAFSDGFHPTPKGHTLLAASVTKALVRAGWR